MLELFFSDMKQFRFSITTIQKCISRHEYPIYYLKSAHVNRETLILAQVNYSAKYTKYIYVLFNSTSRELFQICKRK